jgi:hypothetical protein
MDARISALAHNLRNELADRRLLDGQAAGSSDDSVWARRPVPPARVEVPTCSPERVLRDDHGRNACYPSRVPRGSARSRQGMKHVQARTMQPVR